MSIPSVPWLHLALPLLGRRLVVVDPGSQFVRVLVVDAGLGAPRVVHFQTLTGSEADPEQAELVAEHLHDLFAAAGPHERVLVLPQYRVISHVLDIPTASAEETRAMLAREARRLSGLDDNALAYDAVKLKPYGRLSAPYWLTLCKREELDTLLDRFASLPETHGAEPPRIVEVTTSGQALFAAATALLPADGNALLVDLRARNSVVAIVVQGQGVGTTTVPVGRNQLFPAPPGATAVDASAIEKWLGELRLALTEWLEDNPDCGLTVSDFRAFLSGVGTADPALLELLNRHGALRFETWEERVTAPHHWPMADYLVPYGAALLALKRAPAGASLLPAEARETRRRCRSLAAVQTVNVLLLGLLLVVLGAGIWQKSALIERKRGLTQQSQSALQTALEIDRLYRQLNLDYERVYPVLLRQRQTVETLQALAAVRAARTNDDFWYVLFADAASYQSGTSGLVLAPLPVAQPVTATNPPAATPASRREFIAELCVPREGEALRRVLSDVVANLKRHVLFSRVDTLPAEQRNDLVDPKVAVSNRVFAIAMEVAGRELPPPRPLPQRTPPDPKRETRRAAATTKPPP